MPKAVRIARSGLQGWRAKVADGVAPPVADRTPLQEDQIRAGIGVLFFVLSVMYIVKTTREAVQQMRGG
jgi:hypothetical protein